ncbi:hypothetical protein E2C01_096825 [Portunus trituberculatus]|uniref:Uncharacterized protein n=2 Tax=Portunus trituberculatus TaxID=210409 RepID=A0A5B7K9H9_PORTR|nr:hypothetical protein [Portunus trituberculatus]
MERTGLRGDRGDRGARDESEGVERQKRHRSRNFTKQEKEVFYSVFSRYATTINDKRSTVDSIR